MIAGEFMRNTGSQGVQAQKKKKSVGQKIVHGVLAWFEQKGSLAVTGRMQDISKNMLNCLPRG